MKIILLFISVLMFFCACDRPYIDCEYPDYSNCITKEPENGKVLLTVTINSENKAVPISIFRGNVENNDVFLYDTAYISNKEYVLPANVFYSVKAQYKSKGRVIHAIDGGYLEKKSYDVCDSVCWVVKDVNLNLKLNY